MRTRGGCTEGVGGWDCIQRPWECAVQREGEGVARGWRASLHGLHYSFPVRFLFLFFCEQSADSVFRLLAFHNFPYFDIFMRKLNFPAYGPAGPKARQGTFGILIIRKTSPSSPSRSSSPHQWHLCSLLLHKSRNYEGPNSGHLNLNPRRLPTSGKQSERRPSTPPPAPHPRRKWVKG